MHAGVLRAEPDQSRDNRRPTLTLGILSLATFMAVLDLFIVNVAFRGIKESFPDSSLSDLSWVLNAYTICFAALLVPLGRLADQHSRKRIVPARARRVHRGQPGVRGRELTVAPRRGASGRGSGRRCVDTGESRPGGPHLRRAGAGPGGADLGRHRSIGHRGRTGHRRVPGRNVVAVGVPHQRACRPARSRRRGTHRPGQP